MTLGIIIESLKAGPETTTTSMDESFVNNTNQIGIMSEDSSPMSLFVYIAEAYIQPIILILGFITNVVSIIVLRRIRMNEVFRICLVSLSYVDAIACLVGFVQLVVEVSFFGGNIIQGTMDPPAIASNTLYFTYLMFMCSSAVMVIVIALIRNIFVLRPMKARAFFTNGITKFVCFMACFVTFLTFLPVSVTIISLSCRKETNVSICDWLESTNVDRHINNYVIYFLGILYGPLTLIIYIVCAISIRIIIKRSIKSLSQMTYHSKNADQHKTSKQLSANDSRSKTAKHITKMLLMILVLDSICTLPYVIQGITLDGCLFKNFKGDKVFDALVEIFLNLRPSYNFYLYSYQSPEFRTHLKLVCCKILCSQPKNNNSTGELEGNPKGHIVARKTLNPSIPPEPAEAQHLMNMSSYSSKQSY